MICANLCSSTKIELEEINSFLEICDGISSPVNISFILASLSASTPVLNKEKKINKNIEKTVFIETTLLRV